MLGEHVTTEAANGVGTVSLDTEALQSCARAYKQWLVAICTWLTAVIAMGIARQAEWYNFALTGIPHAFALTYAFTRIPEVRTGTRLKPARIVAGVYAWLGMVSIPMALAIVGFTVAAVIANGLVLVQMTLAFRFILRSESSRLVAAE